MTHECIKRIKLRIFRWSDIIQKGILSDMLANAASKCFKKNSQLSLHLISTIKIGTRNKPLLPSKEMAASKTPSSDPLRWQPSIPKNGLHPPRKSFFIPLKHKKNLFEVYFIVMLGLSYWIYTILAELVSHTTLA